MRETQQALTRAQKLAQISGTSRAALEQAQADDSEAQAQLKSDLATLQQGEVIAPFSGIVGIRKLDPDDYIQAGQSVTSLAAPGRLKLYFAIPQAQAYNIQPGARLSFTAPLGSGINVSADGTLTALSPALNSSTDAWQAEGLLDHESPALRSGMNGMVSIATGPAFKAFEVPKTALNDSTLGPYILVVGTQHKTDIAQSVYVKILNNSGTTSVITGPDLKAGEQIVCHRWIQTNQRSTSEHRKAMKIWANLLRQPVLVGLAASAVALFGLAALLSLPIRPNHQLPPSLIDISTSFPGAPASAVDSLVTLPLQSAFASISGVEYVTGNSGVGSSDVQAFLAPGASVNGTILNW